jgi:hypothetical protein
MIRALRARPASDLLAVRRPRRLEILIRFPGKVWSKGCSAACDTKPYEFRGPAAEARRSRPAPVPVEPDIGEGRRL